MSEPRALKNPYLDYTGPGCAQDLFDMQGNVSDSKKRHSTTESYKYYGNLKSNWYTIVYMYMVITHSLTRITVILCLASCHACIRYHI